MTVTQTNATDWVIQTPVNPSRANDFVTNLSVMEGSSKPVSQVAKNFSFEILSQPKEWMAFEDSFTRGATTLYCEGVRRAFAYWWLLRKTEITVFKIKTVSFAGGAHHNWVDGCPGILGPPLLGPCYLPIYLHNELKFSDMQKLYFMKDSIKRRYRPWWQILKHDYWRQNAQKFSRFVEQILRKWELVRVRKP